MGAVGEPTLVTSLRLRRGEVTCVTVTGARLATGSGDGTLRLWTWNRDVTWIEQAEQVRAHRYGITAAKFAMSGQLLATAGVDGAARLWAVHGALCARRMLAAPDAAAARSLQWATGERLVVGHDDGGLRVWALRSGTLLAYVRPHEGAVHAIATPASAALLLTACTDGVLKVFDFEEIVTHGREGHAGPSPLLWEDGAHDMGALCATECSAGAATGGHDGRVRVWRVLGSGTERQVAAGAVLTGHTAAVTGLSWVREVLASSSLDRTARLWNSDSGVCLRVLHAHSRYLTCVTLAKDLRFMITASNDKSIRTWSLGNFSFNDDIEPSCNASIHFALGDLEGIGPVNDEVPRNVENLEEDLLSKNSDIHCISRVPHVAAINAVAVSKEHLATACSDGYVRIFKWVKGEDMALELEIELAAHSYPVLAVDFGANGALLLSGGLDGCARLWDVKSGCELAVVSAESAMAGGGEGGGGVRDARVSPQRPPLLLVASDDGHAAIWRIDPPSPDPLHVYVGLADAALCCAWAGDGRVLVIGGEAGELRLLVPPPCADTLWQQADAHDLGVLSCDFAPTFDAQHKEENTKTYLLASGGRDASVKLWLVELEGCHELSVDKGMLKLAKTLAAHGGAVQCVRWGVFGHCEGALALATGGVDRWARVWRVSSGEGGVDAQAVVAVPAGAAGGAPATQLLTLERDTLLAVGSLSGTLAVWKIPHIEALDETEGTDARAWGVEGVSRWLREYVTRPPGFSISESEECRLMEAIRENGLTGVKLLDLPIEELMLVFGYGELSDEKGEQYVDVRERLLDEILWLRRDPLSTELEAEAPHALRCPLTHAVMKEPSRASDGFTYERQNILHWILAKGTEELRSPMSGRRLTSALVEPNYRVRDLLRDYCGWRR